VGVTFAGERLDLEVPEDRLLGVWEGPPGQPAHLVKGLVRDALENPRDYPPLRQAVVPGDRVAIAWDHQIPEARAVLEAVCEVLDQAGVTPESISVVVAGPSGSITDRLPVGVAAVYHDPEDRASLAYLASTSQGRRVYLSREITDADFVLPVGRLGYDEALGYRGPWRSIFPGLSDGDTLRKIRSHGHGAATKRIQIQQLALEESAEVSWLLGSQFQLGVLAGSSGVLELFAGHEAAVRASGCRAVQETWSFRTERRAGLVVVGIDGDGPSNSVEDLADGLATATKLVRRGGKIVALSRVGGPLGPACQRLLGLDDPRSGLTAINRHDGEVDQAAAEQLAHALAWADIYLLSRLEDDVAEDLAMIPLSRPEEARRLAEAADSCLFVSHANRTRAVVLDDNE
jgi:hypothetical protein